MYTSNSVSRVFLHLKTRDTHELVEEQVRRLCIHRHVLHANCHLKLLSLVV